MKTVFKKKPLPALLLAFALGASPIQTLAQDTDSDVLKMAAVEALMLAPEDKAFPLVQKVLASDSSIEVKSRALFILGQMTQPEAHATLLDFARNADSRLRFEAIRTIGISGDPDLMSHLGDLYASGDASTRDAVLEAYLIANDEASVFAIAQNATSEAEFNAAVEKLGAMGATDALRQLRDHPAAAEGLIQAWAIAGDTESLLVVARDDSDPGRQIAALQGLGIAGGVEAQEALVEIYRNTNRRDVREGAMQGMMIAGETDAVLELFKAAADDQEKADLLRLLVMMDSDAALDAINDALDPQP